MPLAANNFHYPCSRVTADEDFGWIFRHTQIWPNFPSAGSFITYSNRSRVGPLLHASANSRLCRECESTAESPEVPGWLLRDLINLPQFHPNLMQFFVQLCMCKLQISSRYAKGSHQWKSDVSHWQLLITSPISSSWLETGTFQVRKHLLPNKVTPEHL